MAGGEVEDKVWRKIPASEWKEIESIKERPNCRVRSSESIVMLIIMRSSRRAFRVYSQVVMSVDVDGTGKEWNLEDWMRMRGRRKTVRISKCAS